MASVIVFLLAIFVLVASRNHPVFTFWLLINLYFDPGGYQGVWFQGNVISNINFTDVIFILCWIPYFSLRDRKGVFNQDKYFNIFFKWMSLYMFYFVFVYGFIIPQINGRAGFMTFLFKSRTYFMAFFLIKPLYFFVKDGLQVHFKIIVFSSAICLTLYFISLIGGLNLIPIATVDRYIDSGIMRITLWSYGLFDWVLNLAFIVLLLKINTKNKRLLFYSGILMAFAIVLTLTRRELIGRVFSLFLIFFIINYVFTTHKKTQIIKLISPLIILLVLLYISFPKYIGYANSEYQSITSLVTTGLDNEGNVDYRLAGTGDVVAMKKLISQNPLFGVGFTRYSYEDLRNFRDLNNPLAGLYAGGELPYLGSIGKMGIVGLILFSPMYVLLLFMCLKLYRIIKNNDINIFIKFNPYELIFVAFTLTFTISKFTFNLFNLFVETYSAAAFLGFAINLCILIACYNNLNKTLDQEKYIPQNNPETVLNS